MNKVSNIFQRTKSDRDGQAMLLTVLALGGTLLGATTIAGLLMIYQIRQNSDIRDSTKAIFAADAGIELTNYILKFPNVEIKDSIELLDKDGQGNGARIDQIICYSTSTTIAPEFEIPCESNGTTRPQLIRSYGVAGRSNRAFEQ
jgi:hypothetical protein